MRVLTVGGYAAAQHMPEQLGARSRLLDRPSCPDTPVNHPCAAAALVLRCTCRRWVSLRPADDKFRANFLWGRRPMLAACAARLRERSDLVWVDLGAGTGVSVGRWEGGG